MTTKPSRYVRPAVPGTLVFQARDHGVIATVARYRSLTSEHIQALVFPGTSIAVVRRRLRLLWSHQLLERVYLPFLLDGGPPPPLARRPIYTLGPRGADLLEAAVEPVAVSTLAHNLIASDWLAAIVAASGGGGDAELVVAEPEPVLWGKIGSARSRGSFIVPDAAATLRIGAASWTFYLEVVRAGVRGGNPTLVDKLRKYAELHHRRFFREAYGHEQVRAVLVAASSVARAERLRAMAADLSYGQRLFWFGSYASDPDTRSLSVFNHSSVFSPIWTDTIGQTHSLIPPPT